MDDSQSEKYIFMALLSQLWEGVFLEEKSAETFKFGMWETT
jgi:hypothetical protein